MIEFIRAFGLFTLAAVSEIGGAYLIWQWQRSGKPLPFAVVGLAALFFYSMIQTTQAFGFGRTFAGYGGIFILIAILWGWLVEKQVPDRWDWLGLGICLVGVVVIIGVPRSA